MLGFEMAYAPSGNYYLATAQHVIDEEKRGKLTEGGKKDGGIYISGSVDTNGSLTIIDPRKEDGGVVIKFPYNSTKPLNLKQSKREILALDKNRSYQVVGYASSEGTSLYNKNLSNKRANRVARFARKVGITVSAINGLGESRCSRNNPANYPSCRKVEIIPK